MNGCVFVVACGQKTTARDGWQEAAEHFPAVLHGKVCSTGFSRSRSSCNSAFGGSDRSAVLWVSPGLGLKHGQLEVRAGIEDACRKLGGTEPRKMWSLRDFRLWRQSQQRGSLQQGVPKGRARGGVMAGPRGERRNGQRQCWQLQWAVQKPAVTSTAVTSTAVTPTAGS